MKRHLTAPLFAAIALTAALSGVARAQSASQGCSYTPGPGNAGKECVDTPRTPPPTPVNTPAAATSGSIQDAPPPGFTQEMWLDMRRWGYTTQSWRKVTQTGALVTPILNANLTTQAIHELWMSGYNFAYWRQVWLPSFAHDFYQSKEEPVYDGPDDFPEEIYYGRHPELARNATPEGEKWAPVFDYDTDSCYPTVAVDANGIRNGGLKPTGHVTGKCRRSTHLSNSNTYHRSGCKTQNGDRYCGHMYALYFEKDQPVWGLTDNATNHRHDIEYVIIWLTNDELTHISYTGHNNTGWAVKTRPKSDFSFTDLSSRHAKIVYHKDGGGTRIFRAASSTEKPENGSGMWHRPTLVSWWNMEGFDGVDAENLQSVFNNVSFGKANAAFKDGSFTKSLNRGRPSGYPEF